MLVAFAVVILLAAYVVGIWAALRVNRRITLSRPAGMNVLAWAVFNLSIRTFVFLMVIIAVTTAVGPIIFLLSGLKLRTWAASHRNDRDRHTRRASYVTHLSRRRWIQTTKRSTCYA